MSTDSSLCYKFVKAAQYGVLDPELANRLVGNLYHSRWLTIGQALLLVYMSSDHGLEDEQIRTLNQIVKWVAEVYFHLFYKIKGQWKTIYGPHHLLTLLRLYRKQDPMVREGVAPYIKSEAWWAHSESILVSLLCSSDIVERNFGVSQIIKIRERAMGQKGRERVREKKIS